MKNHFQTNMLVAIILSVFSLSFTHKYNYFKTSIVISETNSTYKMTASYEQEKTASVVQYMNECIKPDLIFINKVQLEKKVVLKDKTTFYLQYSPGEMKIKLVKSENANASLLKVREICSGLNRVLNH